MKWLEVQIGVAVARETFDKQVDMKPSEKYVTPHTRTLSKLVGFFQTYHFSIKPHADWLKRSHSECGALWAIHDTGTTTCVAVQVEIEHYSVA